MFSGSLAMFLISSIRERGIPDFNALSPCPLEYRSQLTHQQEPQILVRVSICPATDFGVAVPHFCPPQPLPGPAAAADGTGQRPPIL